MSTFIGGFDPIRFSFNIIDALLEKGYLSEEEAKKIIKETLKPSMSEKQKNDIVNSLITEEKG